MIYSDLSEKLINYIQKMIKSLENGEHTPEQYFQIINGLVSALKDMLRSFPPTLISNYTEFFEAFILFGEKCENVTFLRENVDELMSSLILLCECLVTLEQECEEKVHKCSCCGTQVVYEPLSNYHREMQEKYGSKSSIAETLNREQYHCPACGSADRDRLIVSFLEKCCLTEAEENTKVLQIAPAQAVDGWIRDNCPQLDYQTTDLFMEGVSFVSDIQNMHQIVDGTYDLVICSHVLEHVQNDDMALGEMKRILNDSGIIVFLVPIDLSIDKIDEEWGCSEEENWKRFGQGDHCRRYSKQGLLERLRKYFFVHELGRDYFGEEVFQQCGLTDTSTLYVLTKSKDTKLTYHNGLVYDAELINYGPLVTVVMSCYNHEKYVGAAIESVINQTYKNIEFIVADDGSQDKSALVMQQYESYFANSFYYKENKGGRGKELSSLAKGKYVALMNSDDVWDLDKLYYQVDYMEKHPEVGICFTWCDFTDENLNSLGSKLFRQPNRTQYQWVRFFWDNGNALCNPSSLAKREYRQRIQMNGRDCRQLPDFFNWIELIQKCSFYVIPKTLVKMRRYSDEKNSNVSAETFDNAKRQTMECGTHWMWAISGMDDEFFRRAFIDLFLRQDAITHEEIMCEKFFLLLYSKNPFVQYSAFVYLANIYSEVEECLLEKYCYNTKNIANDFIGSGISSVIDWERLC